MAQPVPFRRLIPTDTRSELTRQVDAAPTEHAEAILSSLQLLQQLHDTGTLDLLRGMFGAGDAVVNHVVDIVSAPEMVNVQRNLLGLGTILANIDPDSLHTAIHGKKGSEDAKPPSLFAITKQMNTEEARLGLAAAVGLLGVFGAAIKKERAKPE